MNKFHAYCVVTASEDYFTRVIDEHINGVAKHDILSIKSEERSIKVSDLASLRQFMMQKRQEPAAVVIYDAQKLTIASQNSLLKYLEEPNKMVTVLLMADSAEHVLPTILSRVQLLVENTNNAQIGADALEFYKSQTGIFPDDAILHESKSLLQMTIYERLCYLQQNKLTRLQAMEILQAMALSIHAAIANSKNNTSVQSWVKKQQAVLAAISFLDKNVTPRLVLAQLMVQL